MTRVCETCRVQRPLREFDLGGGQLSAVCLGCADARLRTEDQHARTERRSRIVELEKRRRELIASLVKVDAEIADLRERPSSSKILLDDGGEVDESAFDEDVFGSDVGDRARDMS